MDITRTQVQEKIAQGVTVIDVRRKEELRYGMLPGAINIPLDTLEEHLSHYKGKEVIFYCRSGSRSKLATAIAKAAGVIAYNYKGSILDWSEIDENVRTY